MALLGKTSPNAPIKALSEQELVCDAVEARNAAIEGYFVPDDEETGSSRQEIKESDDDLVLLGDADKLSEKQKQVMLLLKEAMQYSRLNLKQVNLSFSGASVYFFTPMRQDGTPLPSSVIKFDTEECVRDELEKTKKYGRLFGLTTPKVKDAQFLQGADPNEPASVMQIDLCGGIFGLPEFASAPPVQTFSSVLEDELQAKEHRVDILPLINEALERRMYYFTMSTRSIRTVNLAESYKLVRFVGHGILNRAKEGAKRAEKSTALAAGFQNPPDVNDLDPDGSFLFELSGSRKTPKEFFQSFVGYEKLLGEKFQRNVVAGLCHNDLHGGNLLLDSQGLIWLIDFATVKDNVHVLMDLTKFMAASLFMYLKDNVTEGHVNMLAKLLMTTPDATTAFPTSAEEQLKGDSTAVFVMSILSRLRHCMCIYESGDDSPDNDGVPFALAFFSWSTRMLSYSEPSVHQKGRALYCAIAGAQRLLWEAGVDVGPGACKWIEQSRLVWEGQKGRRLSTTGNSGLQLAYYEFGVELPRYLAQVGASEAWSTDVFTREKVHVTEHCIAVSVKFAGRVQPRFVVMPPQAKILLKKLEGVYRDFAPELLKLDVFYGRLLIVGDSGTGKSMLTKQLFSEVAQRQVTEIHAREAAHSREACAAQDKSGLVPVRVPLIDLSRQLEAEPDTSLEADPVNDLLAEWVERTHGQNSVPHQLIRDVRDTSIGNRTMRRMVSGSESESHPGTTVLQSTISAGEGHVEQEQVTGLLLLLDGLDEASSRRLALLEYIQSLLSSEPVHLPVVTSRPGSLGAVELDMFSTMGFSSFCMSALTEEQAKQIAERTVRRMGDSQESIDAVVAQVGNPGYGILIGNPLVLTLLVHVLRKSCADSKRQAEASAPGITRVSSRQGVLKKTDVYQRALKLMLHQSDAAKFMLRDGASDLAMVRRLETLKSARARKLFQAVAWHAHSQHVRALTWDAMAEACNDADMLNVFRETFEQGRMPIFEPVEVASGQDQKLQLTHLSFQELMTGEYTSAIVRHSHAKQKARSYINFFSSNSSKTLSRDRLAEQWWLQVWFHVCEMLDPNVFNVWCDCLAEDPRSKLKVGSMTYRLIMDPVVQAAEGDKARCVRPWEGGWGLQVESIDWENHRAVTKPVLNSCVRKMRNPFSKLSKESIELMEIQWPADGVATILRQAARQPDLDVIRRLLKAGVHYGVCDELGLTPVVAAIDAKRWDALQVFTDHKAELCVSMTTVMSSVHYVNTGYSSWKFYEAFHMTEGHDQLRLAGEPHGILKQAFEGSLTVVPELDANFKDPSSGMTPLMYAAAAGHPKLVAELLRGRAEVNAESTEGSTALTFVCDCARGPMGTECLELLINARADVNHKAGKSYDGRYYHEARGRGNPAGHGASSAGDLEKLELLLKAGYDPNQCNDYGMTDMWKAVDMASTDIMKKLLEQKAELADSRLGLSNGCTHQQTGYASLFSIIAVKGYSVPICSCVFKASTEVLRLCFDSGYDVHGAAEIMGMQLPLPFYLYSVDPELFHADDISKLELVLDRKFDLNAKASWIGFSHMSLAAMFCQSQSALLLFLNRKGDTSKPGGFLTKDFLTTATNSKNEVAVNTYNDWLLMQKDD
ncbi:unnamed protein product [Polarella glacialis]|uniref:Orc1-like AAA ATPase domain-containing protein n=1 Tax=Polarella glacialis TaxID=89957 RepID=A0A813HW70_POLGL|nr:unnamed protein product [Polarella glacialis]